ncbi:MAG: aminoacetone oxidase family FAD-binding enzyme [Chlorobiales bacterium]|nr:aminoacetone oxidase family FAD-binding enzyme [Chlorobiales bacterium]
MNIVTQVLIIGGGAAGIFAALGARHIARENHIPDNKFDIIVLERNPRAGIKIRIAGGGKCNVTHNGDTSDVLQKGFLRKNEQRFLKHALYTLTNKTVMEWLRQHGVKTITRENGRVFPESGLATDVLSAFEDMLKESKIVLIKNERALKVDYKDGIFSVQTTSQLIQTPTLILATGGVSYSKTGTTGDGLSFAQTLGHTIVPVSSALAPIFFQKPPDAELVGVSLRSVGLIVKSGARIASRRGDVLISHRGLTGPACLSLSRDAADMLFKKPGPDQRDKASVFIDFFPEHDTETVQEMIVSHAAQNGNQTIRKFLQTCPIAPPSGSIGNVSPFGTIPTAVVPFIMAQAKLEHEQKWNNLSKASRQALVSALKGFWIGDIQSVPIDHGEVSAGGVTLEEVNPKTMMSRLVPNLFFCGEILDVAGEVGGFNLQAAYSTGWIAGINAARLRTTLQKRTSDDE